MLSSSQFSHVLSLNMKRRQEGGNLIQILPCITTLVKGWVVSQNSWKKAWLKCTQVHSCRLLIFLGFVFLAMQMLKEILCNKRLLFQVVPLKWNSIGSLRIWTGMDYFGRKLNSSPSWSPRMTQAILTVRLKIRHKLHHTFCAYFISEIVKDKSLLEIEWSAGWKLLQKVSVECQVRLLWKQMSFKWKDVAVEVDWPFSGACELASCGPAARCCICCPRFIAILPKHLVYPTSPSSWAVLFFPINCFQLNQQMNTTQLVGEAFRLGVQVDEGACSAGYQDDFDASTVERPRVSHQEVSHTDKGWHCCYKL